jgi:hypothetical protein
VDAQAIMIVALEDSEFGINPVSKFLGAKEARAATDDLTMSLFQSSRLDGT